MVIKTDSGLDLKWNSLQAAYLVDPQGGPQNSIPAIQAAMETWTYVTTSDFSFLYGGTTSKNAEINDNINVISFGQMGTDGTLAENSFWYNPHTGELLESDIKFNTNYAWATDGSPHAYDLQGVLTHELGHALSLDDLYSPGDSQKTMFAYADMGGTSQRTLSEDDMNGITYLYPKMKLPLPAAPDSYAYPQNPDPIFSTDPSLNRPLAVGDMAHGELTLHISFLPSSAPVDIYLAISVGNTYYLITQDNLVQLLSAGIVKWRSNTLGQIDAVPFGTLFSRSLPSGTYYLHALVTPTGTPVEDLSTYYRWDTYFIVP